MIDPKSIEEGSSRNSLEKEIFAVRALLREKGYLLYPQEETIHTHLVGTTELSHQLVHFTKIAYNNYKVCAPKIVKNETYAINIVHVTHKEEKDQKKLETFTKQELTQEIWEIIDNMNDHNKQLYIEYFLKEVKNKCKAAFIDFLNELSDFPDECGIETIHDDVIMSYITIYFLKIKNKST